MLTSKLHLLQGIIMETNQKAIRISGYFYLYKLTSKKGTELKKKKKLVAIFGIYYINVQRRCII